MAEEILEAANVLCKSLGKRTTASLWFSEWELAAALTVAAELPHSDVPNLFVCSWHIQRCFAHWSSPPVWITKPLLWAQTLTVTVCLIRRNLPWWYLQVTGYLEEQNLKILHLTIMDGFKNHHSSPRTAYDFPLIHPAHAQPCTPADGRHPVPGFKQAASILDGGVRPEWSWMTPG